MDSESPSRQTPVWDVPTRLFHWCLVIAVTIAWLTQGDARWLDLHLYAGYVIVASLMFRLVWGVAGGRYARFRNFLYSPTELIRHTRALARGNARRYAGHNPLGAVAIIIMLALLSAIAISGLMVLGGEERHGWLAEVVSFPIGTQAHVVHELVADALLAVIALHVAGVVIESVLSRDNLVRAMITGKKRNIPDCVPTYPFRVLGSALAVALAAVSTAYFLPYLQASEEEPYLPFVGPQLAHNEMWVMECSDCHIPYHPSLLPQRSWRRIFNEQGSHFGEDLMLTGTKRDVLEEFALRYAAETHPTEAAWQIDTSIEREQTPTRISETGYWKTAHRDIDDAVWNRKNIDSKAKCEACHADAEEGTFRDGAIYIPDAQPAVEPRIVQAMANTADEQTSKQRNR